MSEPLSRAERLQAEANAASAARWNNWADDIGARLMRAETRLAGLLGVDGAPVDDGEEIGLVMVLNDWFGGERKERSAAIAKLCDAWTARLEAEIATLSETLTQKLDSKIFDLGELKKFRSDVDAAGRQTRADVEKLFDGLSARFAEIERRVDAVDARRRADRVVSRGDVVKGVALVGGVIGRIDKKVDALTERLGRVEAALADDGASQQPGTLRIGAWG
jgi:hypothetical protein